MDRLLVQFVERCPALPALNRRVPAVEIPNVASHVGASNLLAAVLACLHDLLLLAPLAGGG